MVFQQPQKFLDLCEKLKVTKPDIASVKERLDIKPRGVGFVFEYLAYKTLMDLAKSFDIEPLQKKEVSNLFKPFKVESSPQTGQGYTVFRDREPLSEFDAIFKAGNIEYWFFEATCAVRDEYQFFPNKQLLLLWGLAKNNKIACTHIMTQDAYERLSSGIFSKYKKVAGELIDVGAMLTFLPITRDDLNNIIYHKKA